MTMLRPIPLLLLCSLTLLGDSATDSVELVRKASEALRVRNAAALWLLFDPAMPGYSQLRKDSGALLAAGEAESEISFKKNQGDDRTRTLELDWHMEITVRERSIHTTQRSARVTCKLEQKGGGWKIVSFAPAEFFAPVHAGEVWDELAESAAALTSPPDDSPVNPALFLRIFDPKMPEFDRLREGLLALARRGAIESTVELISNEGDDHVRAVEVDWTLRVLNVATSINTIRKEQRLKLKMEWQGKRWRVTSIDPLAFFAP